MKKLILVAGCVLLALAGLAAPKLLPLAGGRPPAEAPPSHAAAPTRVRAIRLAPEPLAETIHATGTLRAGDAVDLQTEIAGRIVGIHFVEGTRVRAGELLLKFYDADLRAALERATARRNLAASRARRIDELFTHGGTNAQDRDAAFSEVEVQEAEIRLIEAQLARTELRAPFDGWIGLCSVSLGAYVAPATRIATLQHIESMKLDFAAPERFAAAIPPGAPVTFSVSGGPQRFTGRVYAVEPRIDVGTRTVQVRATVDNAEGLLRPGAFAQVEFKVAERDDALLVPAASVIPGLSEKTVFVVADGRASRRTVQTGTRTGTSVELVSGVAPGELVITSGLQTLRSGAAVALAQGD